MTRYDVVAVGEALVDIVRASDGVEAEAPGGSPANVALTLGRRGRSVALVTRLGDDERGATCPDARHHPQDRSADAQPILAKPQDCVQRKAEKIRGGIDRAA